MSTEEILSRVSIETSTHPGEIITAVALIRDGKAILRLEAGGESIETRDPKIVKPVYDATMAALEAMSVAVHELTDEANEKSERIAAALAHLKGSH